jgi:CHRD domain-containing protein
MIRHIHVGRQGRSRKMKSTCAERGLILLGCIVGLAWAAPAGAAAQATKVPLTVAQCTPSVESSATGTADLTFDPATRVVRWSVSYSDLSSAATMVHIHGPAEPGKNGPVMVWLSKQGTAPSSPITGEATLTPEQTKEWEGGTLYVNLHTQSHPACELRGQIKPAG